MRHRFIQLLTLMILVLWIGCSDNDFEENVELKESLQGTWKRVTEPPTMFGEITFNDHTASWYDSTIMMVNDLNGEIQTERGTCPVKFTINDGSIGFTFTATSKETDVLWFLLNVGEKSTIFDYTVENGIVSAGNSWRANQPTGPRNFNSCFIRFSNDRRTVEFCFGGTSITALQCLPYLKVN
jgi:hypothetical protein